MMKISPLHQQQSAVAQTDETERSIAEVTAKYGQDIAERAFQFSLRTVSLVRYLMNSADRVGRILGDQILRSATSIGANIEEATCAESRGDFLHKLRIAQKEARESRYWLRLLREANILDSDRSRAIYQESDEILRIISKIIVNTKASDSRKSER